MQGAAGWLTFISDLFGGATLASSTLISPSGILLSAWCMILRDCLISSTLHRYLSHRERKWRWSTDASNMGKSAPKSSWDIKERCEQKLKAAPKLLVHLTGKGKTCRDKKVQKKGSFKEKNIFLSKKKTENGTKMEQGKKNRSKFEKCSSRTFKNRRHHQPMKPPVLIKGLSLNLAEKVNFNYT